ncbi:hypothetical protein QBC36DRAFT_377258 [Triangularia setosa]|uniref:Uncharacterized protein n=1 Tax=Triangularia setosa TaxID=2587417 RepID=A0AAN6WD42_9PEZI|nr:hypothetical protein QBC36DRAFT_377258 [Podospora setosa]
MHLIDCHPERYGQLSYDYYLNKLRPVTSSRIAQPMRRSQSIHLRTTFSPSVPSTLPLCEPLKASFSKLSGTGDGNLFRERHCYSPIPPINPFPVLHIFRGLASFRIASPSSSSGRGCRRCHKKEWLIMGRKPCLTTICRESTCWVLYYTYTGADWDFRVRTIQFCGKFWTKPTEGPKSRLASGGTMRITTTLMMRAKFSSMGEMKG